MKIHQKVTITFIPLLLIPMFSIGLLAYRALNETVISQSIRQTEGMMREIVSRLSYFTNNVDSNLSLFSNDRLIEKYMLADKESRYDIFMPALLKLFSNYQKAHPEYHAIAIVLPDGGIDVIRSNTSVSQGISEQMLASLKSSDAREVSFFEFTKHNQVFSYFTAKPLVLRDRTLQALHEKPLLRGYLAIIASTQYLQIQLDRYQKSTGSIIVITNSSGEIYLASSDQSYFKAGGRLGRKLGVKADDKFLDIVRGKADKRDVFKVDGNEGYFSYEALNEDYLILGWHRYEKIQAVSDQLAAYITIITLASSLMICFFIYRVLLHLVIRPIEKLEKATKELGAGVLENRIVINRNDEIGLLASAFNKMTEDLRDSNEKIKYLAYHDDLTGLPNRLLFYDYLVHSISSAKRNNCRVAVMFLDLDDFKKVNDTLGHKTGDELLKRVSDIIANCMRESDFVARGGDSSKDMAARIGGDEFLLLLNDMPNALSPNKVAERIIERLSCPIRIAQSEFFLSASIGITMYPEDAGDADDLIKNADIAMYHAKSKGKNSFQYYQDSMNKKMLERLDLENRLRKAVSGNHLFLHYQPQFEPRTKKILGVEALLRWHEPELGLVSPDVFIPIAEDTGIITEIGEWVLREACKQIRQWYERTGQYLKISVNVSAVQFSCTNLQDIIVSALSQASVSEKYLDIEITETTIIKDMRKMIDLLGKLRALGVSVSLDDFGTGYSSLNYIRQFPIDSLKIDRSFVSELCKPKKSSAAIVMAIIDMSHALNLTVIAEGIETQEQYQKMVDWQCDLVQGQYLFGQMSVREIETLIVKSPEFFINPVSQTSTADVSEVSML